MKRSNEEHRRAGVLRRIRCRKPGEESGMALVLVVGSMLILGMLALTALAYTLKSQRFARYDQDYAGAMAAAQSGVEDYLGHLNRDDTYGATPDCTNVALQGSAGCGGPIGWLPVQPGETDPKAASFHYSVDATQSASTGAIKVTSTGRVNGVYRTVDSVVGKGGSTDYVYYTDYESADPANVQVYGSSGTTVVACGSTAPNGQQYWYTGRRTAGCQEITFVSGDILNGPVFSNDAVLSDKATFSAGFTTAYPNCGVVPTTNTNTWNKCLRQDGQNSTAIFGVQPVRAAAPLYLEDTSASFAVDPGCHYYGATRIIFRSNVMTVWSKNSNFVGAATSVAPDGGSAPNCGSGSALASAAGATVPVPSDMVIYAAIAPTTGAGAVTRGLLYGGEIGGEAGRQLPLGTYSASAAAGPTALNQSYTVDKNMLDPRKYRGEGNVYIQGVLSGRVTVAAAQSIVVTGDLVLAGGLNGGDLLGLVATNSVEVMTPRVQKAVSVERDVSCGRHCTTHVYEWGALSSGDYPAEAWPQRVADPTTGTNVPTTGVQIAASIQTLQHSLFVQEYNWGRTREANGSISVRGSIAQRWRGAVGTTGTPTTGYNKDYSYDVRLKYTAPPFFPHWINAQWSLRYSGEVPTPDVLRNP